MSRDRVRSKYLYRTYATKDIDYQDKNIIDDIEKIIFKCLISLVLIILLLIWGIVPVIILTLLGIDYSNLSDFSKAIWMIVSDCLFLLILFKMYHRDIVKDFHNFFNQDWKKHLKTALFYWGIGFIVMACSNYLIAIITNGKIATNEESVREMIQSIPWYMAFELIFYAPFSEELIFRRSLRDIVKNRYVYAILSGLIFGGLHAITSYETAVDLLYFIPYCSLGFAFALLYSKTNNIFSTITVHAIHNTLALVLYLISLS